MFVIARRAKRAVAIQQTSNVPTRCETFAIVRQSCSGNREVFVVADRESLRAKF